MYSRRAQICNMHLLTIYGACVFGSDEILWFKMWIAQTKHHHHHRGRRRRRHTYLCLYNFYLFICTMPAASIQRALRILVELLTDDDDAAFCNVQNKSMDAAAAAGFFSSRV